MFIRGGVHGHTTLGAVCTSRWSSRSSARSKARWDSVASCSAGSTTWSRSGAWDAVRTICASSSLTSLRSQVDVRTRCGLARVARRGPRRRLRAPPPSTSDHQFADEHGPARPRSQLRNPRNEHRYGDTLLGLVPAGGPCRGSCHRRLQLADGARRHRIRPHTHAKTSFLTEDIGPDHTRTELARASSCESVQILAGLSASPTGSRRCSRMYILRGSRRRRRSCSRGPRHRGR